jgi:four helix bundle protein
MPEIAKIRSFTDLRVWHEGHTLVLLIYKITNTFPSKETYSLTDQMRRAAVSVTSNIAEGFGRQTYKEKVQFYYMSLGSLIELTNQIYIARDLAYLPSDDVQNILLQTELVRKMLQGLIQKSKQFRDS